MTEGFGGSHSHCASPRAASRRSSGPRAARAYIKTAMIAITTSRSIRVKPTFCRRPNIARIISGYLIQNRGRRVSLVTVTRSLGEDRAEVRLSSLPEKES